METRVYKNVQKFPIGSPCVSIMQRVVCFIKPSELFCRCPYWGVLIEMANKAHDPFIEYSQIQPSFVHCTSHKRIPGATRACAWECVGALK